MTSSRVIVASVIAGEVRSTPAMMDWADTGAPISDSSMAADLQSHGSFLLADGTA